MLFFLLEAAQIANIRQHAPPYLRNMDCSFMTLQMFHTLSVFLVKCKVDWKENVRKQLNRCKIT